jgi:hypothetical protein
MNQGNREIASVTVAQYGDHNADTFLVVLERCGGSRFLRSPRKTAAIPRVELSIADPGFVVGFSAPNGKALLS